MSDPISHTFPSQDLSTPTSTSSQQHSKQAPPASESPNLSEMKEHSDCLQGNTTLSRRHSDADENLSTDSRALKGHSLEDNAPHQTPLKASALLEENPHDGKVSALSSKTLLKRDVFMFCSGLIDVKYAPDPNLRPKKNPKSSNSKEHEFKPREYVPNPKFPKSKYLMYGPDGSFSPTVLLLDICFHFMFLKSELRAIFFFYLTAKKRQTEHTQKKGCTFLLEYGRNTLRVATQSS